MGESKIQWTDRTWNPVRGCGIVSAGCKNCYAMRQAHRFHGPGQPYEGLTNLTSRGPVWTGRARFVAEKLADPLSWRKPARVFVNSMSDLFHEDVTNEQIAAVFGVMAACPHLTFQVLTKRPERAAKWFAWIAREASETAPADRSNQWWTVHRCASHAANAGVDASRLDRHAFTCWPLPNVWLGVSCEDQKAADERIPPLLQCPSAVRWVSAEPLIGPIDFELDAYGYESNGPAGWVQTERPDWIVVGGESGPSARPCALEWIESVVEQCRDAGVPVFVKQLGARVVSESRAADTDEAGRELGAPDRWLWHAGMDDRKGGDPSEWPDGFNVREFPEESHG